MIGADEDRQHSAPVELARESDFALGRIRVRPSLTEVLIGDEVLRLQPRVMQVLVSLARARGEVVSKDELLASCWGGLSIGDDAINRCIGRLRRLAETEAPGAFTIETLPRIGYRLHRSAEEPASSSPRLKDEEPPSAAVRGPAPRRLLDLRVLLLGLLVVLGLGGIWFAVGRPGWPRTPEGVAVTLFDSPSSDTLARNVADATTDGLEGSLARAGLRALSLDNRELNRLERDVGAVRLGAAFSLSGRVQQNGGSLDIGVTLDDARRHEVLWSANLTQQAAQAKSLERQIAAKVTSVLHCALNDVTATRLDDRYLALHLSACDWQTGFGSNDEGRELFKRMLQRQPRFAQGWGGLAVLNAAAAVDLSPNEAEEALKEARLDAERALKLDPKVGSAYVALAAMAGSNHPWDQQRLLKKGLSVAPEDALLNQAEAELLSNVGRFHDATVYAGRAANLDPWQPSWISELALYLAHDGRLQEARDYIENALQTWPDDMSIHGANLGVEGRYGDTDLALKLLGEPQAVRMWSPALIEDWKQYIQARKSNDPRVINAYANGLLAQLKAGKMDINRALVRLNTLGATDAAFIAVHSSLPSSIHTEGLFRAPPDGQGMWRDPRFILMAARFNLVDFWERSGLWPDFCENPHRPYDCGAAAAKIPPSEVRKG